MTDNLFVAEELSRRKRPRSRRLECLPDIRQQFDYSGTAQRMPASRRARLADSMSAGRMWRENEIAPLSGGVKVAWHLSRKSRARRGIGIDSSPSYLVS